MEFFTDGAFVWLQSYGTTEFVYADRDWFGVSLRPLGDDQPWEAVWRVQRQHLPQPLVQPLLNQDQEDVVFVLLQNAAYGRYLSSSTQMAPRGQWGNLAVQADRNNVDDFRLWWRVERVPYTNQNLVRLRLANSDFQLRANGLHYLRNAVVTTYYRSERTAVTQWTVHVAVLPPLPVAPPQPQQTQGGNSGPGRTIRYVLANDQGYFDQNPQNWHAFTSNDHSVLNLRNHLEQLHGNSNGNMIGFMTYLWIRPGSHGQLMLLVGDLPRGLDPIHIVVFMTRSPAAPAQ